MTHPARRLWRQLETLHAVTYFAPGSAQAMTDLGLKGFWMGYFAGRGAVFGACGPAVVEATFYNFDPSLVRRALPDAWTHTTPDAVIEARSAAAAQVLRDAVPAIDDAASRIVPLLSSAVRSARPDGRPLFAANQVVELSDDPVAALWQCATSLREHRGDGHVAALVATDLSGVESHQLVVGAGMIPDDVLRSVRGFEESTWGAAKDRVRARGLVDDDGRLTAAGAAERDRIEALTDELALQPYVDGLTEPGLDLLPTLLRPLAAAVATAGIVPFPNPIGVERDG